MRPAHRVGYLVAALVVAGAALGGALYLVTARRPAASPTTTTLQPTSTSAASATTTTTAPATTACVPTVATWPAARIASEVLMVIGTFDDLTALTPEAASQVGGFVFLGQPAAGSATSIASGIAGLAAQASGSGDVEPWFSTDEEGGEVTRLKTVIGPLPSARQMASQWTAAQVETAARRQGEAMRNLGITMDLAPVLDTASPTDPVDAEASRSFSTTPQIASADGLAFAEGLEQSGIVPVVKHFPGLGHADANTDEGPATDPPLETLQSHDLIPFEHAFGAALPAVMVSHAMVPGLSGDVPASLSPATYAYLRTTLGFAGVAMTDSLAAGAVSAAGYSEPQAAVKALAAGADLAMVDAATWQACRTSIASGLGNGDLQASALRSSVRRILHAKGIATCAA